MVLWNCLWLVNSDANRLINKRRSSFGVYIWSGLFIYIVGLRPISGYYFGDTANYALSYQRMKTIDSLVISKESDWLFNWLMHSCSKVMDVHCFFLIVEALYIIPVVIACKRWFPNNLKIAMLFFFTAFSFFSYGTNGIRNGMGASLVILALSYINGNNKDKIIAYILSIAAVSVHKSCTLPVLMMLISQLYRNTRIILFFWISSIIISLVAGESLEPFFANLGFDDRLGSYINSDSDNDKFSSTGFRFDFLLYSMMPIILGYYTVVKKKLFDRSYLIILHTYILSNSFWIMLIRASFSNRFAYLSWFLYPIVLAYPLIKLNIWGNKQGRYCAYILLAHVAFTYLMWLR